MSLSRKKNSPALSELITPGEAFSDNNSATNDMLLLNGSNEAEIVLKESQRHYKQLVDGLPVALYTCDKNGYIDLYNKAAVKLWGREPEIGKDKWCGSAKIFETDGITPLSLEDCPMSITIKEGRAVTGKEIIVEQPGGQRKRINPFPSPLFNSKGEVVGGVNMLLDVTEKKDADDKLAWLAAIVHSSNDPIISKTLTGVITSWNEAAEKVFGYTSAEMIGESIIKIIPEERRAEETLILERLKKGYPVEHFETKRITKDHQLIDVSLTSSPIKDIEGNVIGASKIVRDITIQKKLNESLRESELKLKTISNASPVGLWMTDAMGQNIFVNETWIEWTGIPYEEQLGGGWLGKVLEEDRDIAPAKFQECMANREKYSTEFRMIDPDGKLRWCLTEGAPYYNIQGDFAGYAGSVTDITDIKKMEERKDDFIKMASHELKTPITSIKGYVQLLMSIFEEINEEKFQSSRPVVRSSLLTISKQVSKLTRLVSELLDLSRIESGKLELDKTRFDLGGLVEETVQDVRHTTTRHAILVHNDYKGSIYADKDRIGQVLLNLITNAIKYSPEADCVEIFVEGNKETVTIQVKDRGIGIEEKDHERIFERFYRVEGKSEQTYPGFGIGLFIAAEIIQRHEGTIKVRSERGKGSNFIINLPVKTS